MRRITVEQVRRSLARGRLSSRRLYVDPFRDRAGAMVVLGSGRSGTTKLAEVLSSARGTRLIFEPMHVVRSEVVPSTFVWGEYVAPEAERRDLWDVWNALLRGRARGHWIDGHNDSRFAVRRVVKSIAATNLVAWLHRRFPDVPVLYLVRHPFAVAASRMELDATNRQRGSSVWEPLTGPVSEMQLSRLGLFDGPLASRASEITRVCVEAEDLFDRVVVLWCLENAPTLLHPPPGVPVLFFEHVFQAEELRRIARDVVMPLGPHAMDRLERGSATDWRIGPNKKLDDRIHHWTGMVPKDRRRAGLRIIECFGLEGVYNEDPLPLADVPIQS